MSILWNAISGRGTVKERWFNSTLLPRESSVSSWTWMLSETLKALRRPRHSPEKYDGWQRIGSNGRWPDFICAMK